MTESRPMTTEQRFERIENVLTTIAEAQLKTEENVLRIEKTIAATAEAAAASERRILSLIEDTSASLQREMAGMHQEMTSGFQRVEAATLRNTKVLTGGSKAIAAFQAWAEQRDRMDIKRDKEIRDLRARLAKLERTHKRRAS